MRLIIEDNDGTKLVLVKDLEQLDITAGNDQAYIIDQIRKELAAKASTKKPGG